MAVQFKHYNKPNVFRSNKTSHTMILIIIFRRLKLGDAVIVKAHVRSVEGRKVLLYSEMVSPDEAVVYSDSTALYVLLKRTEDGSA